MLINDNTYYVSEIFESIQGEGNFAGANSLFIRFHFCNLSCIWCDTKYTWTEKSGRFSKYSADELKEIISNSKCHHIIFTGGEPTFYRLDKLFVEKKKFHVETNGTLNPLEKLDLKLNDGTGVYRDAMEANIIGQFNWVVSPKLSNSRQGFNENSITFWANQDFNIFKFVTKSSPDIEEIENVITKFKIDRHKVYLGIEGKTLQSQLQPELVDLIIKAGFNFSPRLHIMLWGARRKK
jgi:organic radical activating enzyme